MIIELGYRPVFVPNFVVEPKVRIAEQKTSIKTSKRIKPDDEEQVKADEEKTPATPVDQQTEEVV